MRATSKRLCFIASMALSNRTLSGCLEATLARGFLDFLLVQAAVMSSSMPSNAIKEFRRNIGPRINLWDRTLGPGYVKKLHFQHGGFGGRLQQGFSIPSWIAATEHGVACNQNFSSRPHHVANGVERNSAIDLYAESEAALAANLR